MNEFIILLGWVGIFAPIALGSIGSILGCARAGQAACGALLETDSGHGKYIGLSALPSSMSIFGIVIMLSLSRAVGVANGGGLFAIGVLGGLALLLAGLAQGACCASAINASKLKPKIFGLSIAPAAIVEGFAVFVFVFALILAGSLPAVAAAPK